MKNKTSVQNITRVALGLLLISTSFFFSCPQAGLGPTVDTEAPKVEIISPVTKSVVSRTITISGTASDDKKLNSLSLILEGNTYKRTKEVKNIAVLEDGTWTYDFDTKSLLDDSYKITAEAIDAENKTSSSTVIYEIDNTAPVLVLDRPNSTTESQSEDIDSFGVKISVKGTVTDDHEVRTLSFKVYDSPDDEDPIAEKKFTNFGKDFDLNPGDDFYDTAYGAESGVKTLYYTISAEDEAGNESEVFYLRENLANAGDKDYGGITITSDELSGKNIYSANNQTYYASTDGKDDLEKLAKSEKLLEAAMEYAISGVADPHKSIGKFTVEKSSTPSFSLQGISKTELGNGISADSLADKVQDVISKTTALSFLISPNKNGDLLAANAEDVKERMKVYAVRVTEIKADGSLLNGSDDVTLQDSKNSKRWILLPISGEVKKSGTSYTFNVSAENLGYYTYAIRLVGEDTKGHPFENVGDPYLITIESSNAKPDIVFDDENTMYIKEDGSISISGKAYSHVVPTDDDGGKTYLTLRPVIAGTELNNIKLNGHDSNRIECGDVTLNGYEAIFEFNIDNATVKRYLDPKLTESGKSVLETTVGVRAIDDGLKENTEEIQLRYDKELPTVKINSLLPTLKIDGKDNVNGDLTLNAEWNDRNLAKTIVSVVGERVETNESERVEPKIAEYEIAKYDSKYNSSDIVIDTTKYVDGKDLEIKVTTYDLAKNEKTVSRTVRVNQASDIPSVTFENIYDDIRSYANYPPDSLKNVFYATTDTLRGSLSDDDGISTLEVRAAKYVAGKTAADAVWNQMTSATDNDGYIEVLKDDNESKEYRFEFKLKDKKGDYLTNGEYYLQFRVKDCQEDPSVRETEPVWIAVDEDKPFITLTASEGSFMAGGQKNSIGGSVQDSSGKVVLTTEHTFLAESDSQRKFYTSSDNCATTAHTWTDTFTAPSDSNVYEINYKAKDKYGREESKKVTFKIDMTPPVITVTDWGADLIKTDSSPYKQIKLKAEDKAADDNDSNVSGVKAVYCRISSEGVEPTKWIECGKSGEITVSINFADKFDDESLARFLDKTIKIEFMGEDSAGNKSDPVGQTFNTDRKAPSVEFDAMRSDFKTNKKFVITGTAADNDAASEQVVAYVHSRNITSKDGIIGSGTKLDNTGSASEWEFEVPAADLTPDGLWRVTVVAKDNNNRTNLDEKIDTNDYYEFTADNTAPTVSLSNLSNEDKISSSSFTINGAIIEDTSGIQEVRYTTDGTQVSDSNGTIVFNPSANMQINLTDLKEQDYKIQIRVKDKAGNITFYPKAGTEGDCFITVHVDQESPRATFGNSADTTDIALLQSKENLVIKGFADDAKISSNRQAKSIKLEYNKAGDTVDVTSDTIRNWDKETGEWTYTLPKDKGDGDYVFTLTVTDFADKTTTVSRNVKIDTIAPTLSISSPAEGSSVEDGKIKIKGSASDYGVGFFGKHIFYKLDDREYVGIDYNNSASWESPELNLGTTEGQHTISVYAEDALGNATEPETRTFYFDNSQPVITETKIGTTDTVSSGATVEFSGTWTETNGVNKIQIQYRKDGGNLQPLETFDYSANPPKTAADGTENWSCSKNDFASGTYEFEITIEDIAGKTNTLTRRVKIDLAAPKAPANIHAEGNSSTSAAGTYYSDKIKFTGTASDDDGQSASGIKEVQYSLDGANWSSDNMMGTSNWQVEIPGTSFSEEKEYTVYFRAIDNSNNVGPVSTTPVLIDKNNPVATIAADGEERTGAYSTKTISLSGEASDTNEVVSAELTVAKDGEAPVAATAGNGDGEFNFDSTSGTWTYSKTVPADEESTYDFVLTVTDIAGKTATKTQSLKVDTKAPELTTTLTDEAVYTNKTTQTFSVRAQDGSSGLAAADAITAVLYPSSADKAAGKNGAAQTISGNSLTVNFAQKHGQVVVVTTKDRLGNTQEYAYKVDVDTERPAVSGINGVPVSGYLRAGDIYSFGGTATDNLGVKKIEVTATLGGVAVNNDTFPYSREFDDGKTDLSAADLEIPDFAAGTAANNGTWRFNITASDKAGNSTSSTVEFVVDVSAPEIESITDVPVKTTDTVLPFLFKGKAKDTGTSGISKIEYKIGADGIWTEGTAGSNWLAEVQELAEGSGKIYVRATDGAGNISDEVSKDFFYDKARPSVSVSGETSRQYKEAFTLAGTASDTNGLSKVTITQTKAGTEGSLTKELTVDGTDADWKAENVFPLSGNDTAYTAEAISRNEADGTYEYTIKVTDVATKTTTAAQKITVTFDTKAPVAPVVSTPSASETGKKALSGATYRFSGTVADNEGGVGIAGVEYILETSELALDAASTGTAAELDSAGRNWNFTKDLATGNGAAGTLSEGTYYLYVRATDKAGNVGEWSAARVFDVDQSAPSVTIDSELTAGVNYFGPKTNSGTITIKGTVSDTRGLDSDKAVELSIGGTEIAAVTKEGAATGTWSVTVPAAKVNKNSNTTISVTAKDAVGKTTAGTCIVYYDDEAPSFSTNLTDNAKIGDNLTKTYTINRSDSGSGLASSGDLVMTYNGTDKTISPGATSVDITFDEGNGQTVSFTAKDAVGNTKVYSYKVSADVTSPELKEITPAPVYLKKGETFNFGGTASDNLGVAKVTVTATKDGNAVGSEVYSHEKTFGAGKKALTSEDLGIPSFAAGTDSENNGTWRFTITVYDEVGKNASTSVEFTVDVSSPEVTGITAYPIKNVDSITPYTFRGTAEDVGSGISTIEYSLTSSEGPWTVVDGSGKNWYSDVAFASEGAGTIYVRATDAAGNVGEVKSQEYYFDKAGPSISVEGGTVRQEQGLFTLEGTASDTNGLTKVTITQTKAGSEGSLTKELTVNGTTYNWAAENAFPLKGETAYTTEEISRNEADGTYTYTIKVSDAAEKVTTAPAVTVTIDTTAPNVPVISAPKETARSDKAVSGTSFKFSGTVADNEGGVGIAKVEYVLDTTAQTLTPASEGTAAELFNNGTNWNFTKDLATGTAAEGSDALSEGTYYLYVRATDAAGNKSGWSEARVFDVDQSAPALALDAEFTAGTNYFGGPGVNSITVKGTVSDSYKLDDTDAVTLKAGDRTFAGQVSDGKWSATINASDIEANKLTAISITALDGVGKTTSTSTSVYYDNKAPSLTTSFKDGESLTTSTEKEYTIDVSDLGSGLKESGYLSYTYNGKTKQVTDGATSVTITFNEGNDQPVVFNVEDKLGNKASYRFTANVDTKAPSITEIKAAPAYLRAGDTYSFGGKTGDEIGVEKVRVTATHGNETTDHQDTITYSPVKQSADLTIKDFEAGTDSANNGTWRFNITASDKAGNSTSTTVEFVVDVSAPVITEITSVPEKSRDTVLPFDFRGTANDVGDSGLAKIEYSLTGADDSWKEATTGKNWIALVSGDELTTEGAGTIYVRATDVAGNTGTVVTKNFYFDSSKPTVSVKGESTRQASALFTLEGTASDTNGLTKVTITQTKDGVSYTKTIDVSGTSAGWKAENAFPLSADDTAYTADSVKANNADGEYTYTIVATDKAGKTSAVSTVTVTIDTTAPDVPAISTPSASETGTNALTGTNYKFSGTVSDNTGGVGVKKVEYALLNSAIAPGGAPSDSTVTVATLDSAGTKWSFDKGLVDGTSGDADNLGEGTYWLYVRATDKADNVSDWSTGLKFDIDRSNPSITINSSLTQGTNYFGGTKGNSITLSGTVSDTRGLDSDKAVELSIGGTGIAAVTKEGAATGTWSAVVHSSDVVPNALNTVKVTAKDEVGKTVSTTCDVFFDNAAPTFSTTLVNGSSITDSATQTYTVSRADNGVGLADTGALKYTYKGSTVTVEPSETSVKINFDQGNDQTVVFTVTDKLGNTADHSYTVNVDTESPVLSGLSEVPANGYLAKNGTYSFVKETTVARDNIGIASVTVTSVHGSDTSTHYSKTFDPILKNGDESVAFSLGIPTFEAGTDSVKNGTWRFTITIADKAGRTTSESVEFAVDVSSPNVKEITAYPKQNVDSITPYTFRGTAEDVGSGISTIEYSLTSSEGSWRVVDGSGKNWYSDVALEQEGAGTIYVRATDGAGNVGEVKSQKYYFDKAGPSITVNGGTVRQEQGLFTLAGNASDTNALTKVTITQTKAGTEGSLTKELTVSGKKDSWSWSATDAFPLSADDTAYTAEEISRNKADGTYTYTVTVTDAAEKTATAPVVTVTIDTTAPNVPVISSPAATARADKAVNGTSYKFSGTVSDNNGGVGIAKVEYVLSKTVQTLTAASEGTAAELFNNATNWNFTKDLATGSAAEGSEALSEGTYYLYVRATDAAGNKSGWSEARVFDVDQSVPALALDAEFTAGTNYFGGPGVNSITIKGTVSDSYKLNSTAAVTLKAGDKTLATIPAGDVGSDGKWSATINASDIEANKLTAISITALDGVGKTSSVSTSVYYDNKAPTLTTSFKDGESLTTSTTKEYTIDVSDLGSGLKESGYLSYTYYGETTPISGSSVTITFHEGNDQVVLFNVEDKLGNKASYRFTANVDTKAPSITEITAAPSYLKAEGTYSFGGKTGDEIGVEKVKVTATHGNETTDYETITYNPVVQSEDLAIKDFAAGTDSANNGTWRFNITASDKAGNSTSTTVEFVVDVSAPEITGITSVPTKERDTVLPFDFRGTAVDVGDSGLAKIEYSLTGTEDSWKEATTGKNWIALVSEEELTEEGEGTIFVRATDAAGNTGAVESKEFYFDRSKPTVSVTGESTRQASALFTLEGSASDTNGLTKVTITQTKTGTEGSLTKELTVSDKTYSWSWSAENAFPLSADNTAYTADSVKANNADGEYTYTIVATDKAGKTSAVSTVTVTIDTTAPSSIAITAPTAADTGNNALNGTSYKFSGTVADNVGGVGIAKVEYALLSAPLAEKGVPSDGAIQEATLASSGTAWSFNKDLATGTAVEGSDALSEGTYYLYVRATDAAGNKSGWSAARVFDVDQSAPALALASGLTAGTNYFGGADSTSITISGTAGDSYKLDDTAAVILKAGDKTLATIAAANVGADGNWSATINASDITANTLVTITATAKDAVGKTSASSCNVYYDSEAPALTVTSPAEGTITTTGKFTIKGSIMDSGAGIDTASAERPTIAYTVKNTKNNTGSSIVFADKVSLEAADYNGASWTKDITLADGSKEGTLELSFTVQDKLGNTSTTEPITFYFDKSSPNLTETAVGNDVKYTNKSVSMKGTAEDSNMLESVKLSVTGGTLGSAYGLTAYTNGSETETADDDTIKTSVGWTSEIVAGTAMPGEGTYSVTVTATDTAGNTRSVERSIVYDLTAPVFKTENDKKPRITTVAADATNGWYGTGELDFEGILTENYELEKVEYSLDDGNTWTRFDTENVSDGIRFSKKLVFTNSGTYTVIIKATDRAGNEGTTEVTGIQIDLTVPGVSITSPESGKTVNGESDVNVTVSAKDVHSGLSGIKVQLNNSDFSSNNDLITASTEGEDGAKIYEATIGKSGITAAGTIYVQAIDNVGKTTVTSVPFGFDNVPPTLSITSPADETEINKEIDIIGRAGDTALKNVTVYCQNVATAEDFAADNAEAWSSIGSFDGTAGYNWNVHLDTATAYTDGTLLYVKAVAEDEAGNKTETNVFQYKINQDADRPVITLTNVSIWGTDKGFMSKDNVSGIKDQSTLIGTVNDDDGIAEMKVYNEAGEDISENVQFKYGNYNWTLKLNGDGYQEIEFVVKDTAGTTFKTGVYETYSLNSITLKDNDGNAIGTKGGYYGGDVKEGNETPYDTRLYLTVDNLAPTVLKTEFRLRDEDPWVSDLGAITVGGENKELQVRQYVYDANSVQGVTVSIDKMTGDTAKETGYYSKSADAKGTIEEGGKTYTGYEATLNVEKLVSRSLQIKISASDMSGHASNVSYAVTLDNTPPSLEVNSHNYGQQVSGTVQLKGATEGSATKLQYLVSTSAEKMATDADAWKTAPEIVTKDYWRIYFDNELAKNSGENADGWAHAQYLKYYVADLIPGAEKNAEGVIVKAGTAGTTDVKYTDLVTLYVHFRMEDAVKNTSTSNPFALVVDPQGDLPSIEVSYPDAYTEEKNGTRTEGVTLGGTIRMYGSADDSENPAGMTAWMQIDTKYGGYGSPFNWDPDAEELSTGEYTISDIVINGKDKGEKAIQIGSGISWTVKLNTKNEFSGKIGVKVFMYDKDGNKSNEEIRMITISTGAPVFGSSQDFYLQQYDGAGNVTASVQYSDGMWLKGKWFLVGSIEDDGGITAISVKKDGTNTVLLGDGVGVGSKYFVPTTKDEEVVYERDWGSTKGYVIKYEVGDDTEDTFGTLTYEISATDNVEISSGKPNTTTKIISLQFDNKAPVMAEKGDSAFNISDEVVQKNGFYTLGSTVKEEGDAVSSQSGFERLAFYFVRKGSIDKGTVDAVYDPFLTKTTPGNRLSGLKNVDGLYWKEIDVVERDPNNLAKLTLPSADPNVHTGGLVKIGGAIYRINSLESDGTVVVLSGSPELANTEAMFAIAQIVDNTASESNGGERQANGYYDEVKYDDGDTMVEEVTKQGTTYYWSASINSRNIPDGDVEIHLVAFDKAGNYSEQTISAEVSNNKPKIAAVYYGNDDNGDGEVKDEEYKVKNWALNYENNAVPSATGTVKNYDIGALQDVVTINGGESYESALTVRGAASIKPQVVGGNGKLYYNYTVKELNGDKFAENPYYAITGLKDFGTGTERTDQTADVTTGSVAGIVKTDGINDGINFSVKDLLSKDNEGKKIAKGVQQFSFTIWDSTDDTIPGENSLNTTVNIVMDVAILDETKPVVEINPFYWKGIKENSIYDSSSSSVEKFSDLKGHIELEGDLPETFNETSGLMDKLMDRDPKVSGKVVITGTASDNNLLSELFIRLDGMENNLSGLTIKEVGEAKTKYYCVATYNPTERTWTSHLENLAGKGLVFAVDPQSFADGHHVNWSLTWDTEKVEGVAKLDAALKVLATDLGSPTLSKDGETVTYKSNVSVEGSVQTKKGALTAYYRMDVVPYVVKVYTTLAKQKNSNWSVYNRTAQGHYPVQSVIQKADDTQSGTSARIKTSEDVTLHGFNLNGTVAAKDKDNGNLEMSTFAPTGTAMSQIKFNVANLASGELEATVNGIALINNLNNNDAMGSATVDGTANVNKYNMQGNGDTNNILTDDLVFDVWEFNDRAAVPINGMATGVQMQVNQNSKLLNFAFANGGLYFSMGNGTYSSQYWAGDYDTFAGPSVGLHVDELGYTYATDSGGDTNTSGSVDKYDLWSSRFGIGTRGQTGTLTAAGNALNLEEIALKLGPHTNNLNYSLMKYRYLSSEMASAVHNNNTNLYLVNYDALTDEIRFRAGTFTKTSGMENAGGFVDEYNTATSSYYSTNNCQVIANNSVSGGSFYKDDNGGKTTVAAISGRGAGQYVDVAVATNGPDNKDVACVVWFDAYDNCLKYTYSVDPIGNWNSLKKNRNADGWSTPVKIFSEGGEYCQIVVDANNHLHIAAYAGNGDVKYAYLDRYDSAASYDESTNSCTVDASGAVGEHLTLDVALDDTGNSIPYIGYFTAAIKAPKYAYLVDTTHANKVPAGVDDDERFTGAWEVTVVPTPSRLTSNREDKVNIGVFKTEEGVLNWSTTDGSQPAANGSNIGTNEASSTSKGYNSTETSKAYGNGSKNAVFAYQISGGSGSCIETAQMR